MTEIYKKVFVSLQGIVCTLLFTGWLVAWGAEVKTETINFMVADHIVKLAEIQVADEEGHYAGVASRKGIAFFGNREIAHYQCWETYDSDFSKMKKSLKGYSLLTFEDGSTVTFTFHGVATSQLPWWYSHGRTHAKGTGEYVRGTGRFEGIQGTISYTGKGIIHYSEEIGTRGDRYWEVTATYTLPP